MVYETDVYRISCEDESTSDILLYHLEKKAGELALLFGIPYPPADLKIHIDILDKQSFEDKKSLHFRKSAGSEIVAFSTVSICAVSYRTIHDQYTPEEYCRVILHELVHVLQRITTRISPEQNVWLYEAVACYLAGQRADVSYREKTHTPWDIFKKNFYAVPECYSIAYHLGSALMSSCAPGEAAARCSDVVHCETVCAQAYRNLFR